MLLTGANGALNDVQLNGDKTIAVAFVNVTGSIIDDFVFEVTIAKGLDAATIAHNFTCQAPDAYFQSCTVSYNPATGVLTYDYFGVNPPETGSAGIRDQLGSERGEREGIPACQFSISVCQALGRGMFEIQLRGWKSDLRGIDPNTGRFVNLYTGLPTFNSSFNVPEPVFGFTFVTELLLFAGGLKLFGGHRDRRPRFSS